MPRSFDQFHDYWRSLASGGTPDSSVFDPVPVLHLLPHLIFVDIEDNPFRVRFRHSGTKFEDIAGIDISNRYLDEFGGPQTQPAVDILTEHYRGCRHSGRPSFGKFHWPDDKGGIVQVEFAIFPFAVHGIVRQCIAIEDYGAANVALFNNNLRLLPGTKDESPEPTDTPSPLAQSQMR